MTRRRRRRKVPLLQRALKEKTLQGRPLLS
jgi:hypothetical protein